MQSNWISNIRNIFKRGKEFECPVCLEPYNSIIESKFPMMVCRYQHLTCKSCSQQIMKNNKKCAICKQNFSQSVKIFRIMVEFMQHLSNVEALITNQLQKIVIDGQKWKQMYNKQVRHSRELAQKLKMKDGQIQKILKQLDEPIIMKVPQNKQNREKLTKYEEQQLQDRIIRQVQLNPSNLKVKNWEELGKQKQLWLEKSGIEVLPSQFYKLQQLRRLNLSHNRLTYISKRLSDMKNLQSLYIDGNPLGQLPQFLSQLPNLKTLSIDLNWLGNNCLQQFPLRQAKKLKQLRVYQIQTIQKQKQKKLKSQCKSRKIKLIINDTEEEL